MKMLSFGSMNIDHVYKVEEFVKAGQTISAISHDVFSGGKGLNQSIALAKAGADVYQAGVIGQDGDMLINTLRSVGVKTDYVRKYDGPSSHTIIQIDKRGNNCIIVCSGKNLIVREEHIDQALENFSEEDYIFLQNEIDNVAMIMEKAKNKGLKIVFNPSPINDNIYKYPLNLVDYLILNEYEGTALTGANEPEEICDILMEKYPGVKIVLTLGEKGAIYKDCSQYIKQPVFPVEAVDTTAAGDTFTGYFFASIASGKSEAEALRLASAASSITVSRMGAGDSIPTLDEVMERYGA